MKCKGTDPISLQILEMLGAPKNVRSLVLRMAVDEVTTVKVEYYPEFGTNALKLFEHYELHRVAPKSDPSLANA